MLLNYSRRLIQLGFLLFLLGLLTGLVVPLLTNPRLGLSSHLEGVMNGLFLIGLGLVWPLLQLGDTTKTVTFGLAMYGTFTNWFATLLSALWGVGATSMPIAAGTYQGAALQEGIIKALLLSLSVAMVLVCMFVLWGLKTVNSNNPQLTAQPRSDID